MLNGVYWKGRYRGRCPMLKAQRGRPTNSVCTMMMAFYMKVTSEVKTGAERGIPFRE